MGNRALQDALPTHDHYTTHLPVWSFASESTTDAEPRERIERAAALCLKASLSSGGQVRSCVREKDARAVAPRLRRNIWTDCALLPHDLTAHGIAYTYNFKLSYDYEVDWVKIF